MLHSSPGSKRATLICSPRVADGSRGACGDNASSRSVACPRYSDMRNVSVSCGRLLSMRGSLAPNVRHSSFTLVTTPLCSGSNRPLPDLLTNSIETLWMTSRETAIYYVWNRAGRANARRSHAIGVLPIRVISLSRLHGKVFALHCQLDVMITRGCAVFVGCIAHAVLGS
jgi:hypothetical protein